MYSYGVVVWELCCRDVPYRGMHSLQAAVAVMNHTLTLDVPASAPPVLVSIMCVSSFQLYFFNPIRLFVALTSISTAETFRLMH